MIMSVKSSFAGILSSIKGAHFLSFRKDDRILATLVVETGK